MHRDLESPHSVAKSQRRSRISLSIRGLFLVSLVVLFATMYLYERHRADGLQGKLNAFASPIRLQMQQMQSTIRKRELALRYAKASLKAENLSLTQDLKDESEQGLLNSVGLRRELANIRNVELRLERDRAALAELQRKLDAIQSDPAPNDLDGDDSIKK